VEGVLRLKRALGISDLHKRDVDFNPIGGYTLATDLVMEDLLDFAKHEKIDYVFYFGDVFDKGYRSIRASYSHENQLREMGSIVKDNQFLCLGNHFFIERDSNPEIYMIQPNERYAPAEKVWAKTPILKVVDTLNIGCMQFSFFHYNKKDKYYVAERSSGVKHHVGIYHDDVAIPASIRKRAGVPCETESGYYEQIYSNVDTACFGHWHLPIGVEYLLLNGRKIPMIIPGSLCVTKSDELHKSVKLPVWNISDNAWSIEFHEFSLHIDKLKLYGGKAEKTVPDGFTVDDDNYGSKSIEILSDSIATHLSLIEYLKSEGFTDLDLDYIRKAADGSVDFKSAISIAIKRRVQGWTTK
jgi:hypothetical protein